MKAAGSSLLAFACLACQTLPDVSPAEAGPQIVAWIEQGDSDRASELFQKVSGRPEYREMIYPVVYDEARLRYDQRDLALSADLLRFLVRHYDQAVSAREGLLYVLFVERAVEGVPERARLEEMNELLVELQGGAPLPAFAELAAAQMAIDAGRLDDARLALRRFQERWNGEPPELGDSVQDLDRYLRSHGDAQGDAARRS